MKRVVASISGGKDSIFALYKAMEMGYEVVCVFNTISSDHKRVRFHGLKAQTLQKQAEALDLPLYQIATTPENYEQEYRAGLKNIIEKEHVQGLVLGDIFLQDCFDWAKKICDDFNIQLIEPLWKIPSQQLFQDFVSTGFDATVVSTQASFLNQSWVGRKLDQSFLNDIQQLPDLDVCAENGEYHSFVTNGPIFKHSVQIKVNGTVNIDGYWFLDID